jgi:sugar lactone lactonase YvrE
MNFEGCSKSVSMPRLLATAFLSVLFLCICGLAAYAQNTIYTVAGGGSWNGTATGPNADLAGPSAVAKDTLGNTYIADPSADTVFKVDPSGNLTVFAGIGYPSEHPANGNGHPANQTSLNFPAGVATDKSGNVYIADTVNYLIRKVNSNGLMLPVAGTTKLCQDSTKPCGDGGTATSASFSYPIGVATDAAGNVYIADTGDNRIRVVNVGKTTITVAGVTIPAGMIQTVAGNGLQCMNPVAPNCGDGGLATAAQLNSPQGVAVDSTGNIYISDSGDQRIRIVSASTGIISAYAGSGNSCSPRVGCGNNGPATAANFNNPWQIALDASGNLFITDAPMNCVWQVNASTQVITVVAGFGLPGFSGDGGPATAAVLNTTRGVAVDTSGNVAIADTGNQRIRQFMVGGNINTLAGGGSGNDGSVATSAILGGGRGVALDSAGNLYIADTYNNRIREVTPSSPPAGIGTIAPIAGTGLAGFSGDGGSALSAQLNFPSAVAVDSANNVYFSDAGNFVIRKYNPGTGFVAVVAGTPQGSCDAFPCGDGGPALQATFARPTSIALDSAGNIYVADAGTHSIRVVNMGGSTITVAGVSIPPGNIQTVAGTNGTACANPLAGQCGDGGLSTAAQLNSPFGVAVDASGNIFIADTGDNRIRKVVAGNIIPYAYTGLSGFGPFTGLATKATYNTPHYIALDPRGNLYVSGSDFDSVIERINAVNKSVVPVVGVATNPKFYGFSGDGGLATLASINNAGVAIDGSGHLYIAEDGNNRVREVLLTPAATPSVTTLNFPTQPVHTTSPTQTFLLTNNGSDDLFITSTSVSGPFKQRGTTCASNVLPAGAVCRFNLSFTPTAVGPVSGSIIINDNAFGSPSQTVTLNGTGQ